MSMRFAAALAVLVMTSAACSGAGDEPRQEDGGTQGPGATGSAAPEDRVETVVEEAPYPEGPLWLDGRLAYTLYSEDRVMTWDEGGGPAPLWEEPGCGPSGLVETPEDTVLVTCYDSGTVVEITRSGEVADTVRTDSRGRPFPGPNDFAADASGGIYMTASGRYAADAPARGQVYYRPPGGGFVPVARGLHYANGLAVVDDGRTLLVAEMLERRVLAYRIGDRGRLSRGRVFTRVDRIAPVPEARRGPLDGPDGLATDGRGNVFVAQNGAGRVLMVDLRGRLLDRWTVPADAVTNVTTGSDAETLYVTATFDPMRAPYPGSVFRIDRD